MMQDKQIKEERAQAFKLLAKAFDDDCGLGVWHSEEEFLLKVLKERHEQGDDNYEYWIEVLEERIASRETNSDL